MSGASRSKDPVAEKIGERIKKVRKMADYKTQKAFREKLPVNWGNSRLGGYEAGYAIPHPEDIVLIAELTGSSACWIMFGVGPIRASNRDVQAIRHQNLLYLANEFAAAIASACEISADDLQTFIDNPQKRITVRIARKVEMAAAKKKGWLDEQHIESDGLCSNFPVDLRELMSIYSELDSAGQKALLVTARALSGSIS